MAVINFNMINELLQDNIYNNIELAIEYKNIKEAIEVITSLKIFIISINLYNIKRNNSHDEYFNSLRENIMNKIRIFKIAEGAKSTNNIETFARNIQCDSINLLDVIMQCFQLLYDFCHTIDNENEKLRVSKLSVFSCSNSFSSIYTSEIKTYIPCNCKSIVSIKDKKNIISIKIANHHFNKKCSLQDLYNEMSIEELLETPMNYCNSSSNIDCEYKESPLIEEYNNENLFLNMHIKENDKNYDINKLKKKVDENISSIQEIQKTVFDERKKNNKELFLKTKVNFNQISDILILNYIINATYLNSNIKQNQFLSLPIFFNSITNNDRDFHKLSGFVTHIGLNLNGGHYIYYRLDYDDNNKSRPIGLTQFNDSIVTKVENFDINYLENNNNNFSIHLYQESHLLESISYILYERENIFNNNNNNNNNNNINNNNDNNNDNNSSDNNNNNNNNNNNYNNNNNVLFENDPIDLLVRTDCRISNYYGNNNLYSLK